MLMKYEGVKEDCSEGVEQVVRGSREGCEINSIRTGHCRATQAGRSSLYSRPRWQRLFPAWYPAGGALLAPNMA
jgi:hypothetical protein